jgi:hypothetical protein
MFLCTLSCRWCCYLVVHHHGGPLSVLAGVDKQVILFYRGVIVIGCTGTTIPMVWLWVPCFRTQFSSHVLLSVRLLCICCKKRHCLQRKYMNGKLGSPVDNIEGCLVFSSPTDADLLLPVLQHWSSVAPEIMLFPPASMQTVHDIVMYGCITAAQTKTLVSSSDGMRRILSFFQARRNALRPRGPHAASQRADTIDECVLNHLPVCDTLLSLFRVCLPIARKCLFGRTDFESKPFPDLTSPWNNLTDFEKYIRSGVSQHIPVCRTMPRYAIDEVNAVSRAKRRSQRQQDDDSILEELKNQSAMRGVT